MTACAICGIVGVYCVFLDKAPLGSAINRGLTFLMASAIVAAVGFKATMKGGGDVAG